MIIAGTGHRPPKLGGYGEDVFLRLVHLGRGYLDACRPEKVISGMALGWDQALAQAAVDLGIPFIAAVPFNEFSSKWPAVSQDRLQHLLWSASQMVIISQVPGVQALQQRNEWMVDRADKMAALWDGSFGGTFNCIRYAEKKGVPIDNLWSRWRPGDFTELLR